MIPLCICLCLIDGEESDASRSPCHQRSVALFFKFFLQNIAVSMFQPVFTGLYIDALDFRSEARELVDAFDEV